MDGSPLRKMLVGLHADGPESRVEYALRLGAGTVPLADRTGKPFTLRFTGARTCISCGMRVKKFYGQGLCYPCFRDAPEASPCIIRPELCRAHFGEGRDIQWELDHHVQEHIVYLAFTGGVKVGVTRSTQVPVRWIDQGAELAVPIARVPYRQLAGAIECDLKRIFSDRTDWRAMLTLRPADAEVLLLARGKALAQVDPSLRAYMLPDEKPLRLTYPLPPVPPRLVSVQLDKLDEIDGRLLGVKGQYLVWGDGRVLNVRNHSGYHVEVE
jgi:hypothetical protein